MAGLNTLQLWQRLSSKPGGKWLFSRLLCFKAPYFGSISPRITELKPGRCEVRVHKRRAVLNHIGTVHAIALCNMAELAGGVMTEITIPASNRWIPKGMTVEYLKKASRDVVAVATPESTDFDFSSAGDYPVLVEVREVGGEIVFKASIRMWVSPKKDG